MSQDPYGQQPPYQPPHPNAPMHPAIQYAPVPTQKPEPTTVVKIGTYLIYAVALYMIMRAIVGLDDFGFQTYHTENGKTTEVNSSMGLGYVISAIFAAFTILLGFFYSKGHGWARITALVLGLLVPFVICSTSCSPYSPSRWYSPLHLRWMGHSRYLSALLYT
ncbi:Uncharacterised protein [Rothia dentocariosa]|uniref:Uncharacterized protein n=1 Tax=Rothia dentocariosa TaxID=2047 RepID=A0A448UX72_9MICC|nr:Uncharacterised protein [Rothia dentocariosa]